VRHDGGTWPQTQCKFNINEREQRKEDNKEIRECSENSRLNTSYDIGEQKKRNERMLKSQRYPAQGEKDGRVQVDTDVSWGKQE